MKNKIKFQGATGVVAVIAGKKKDGALFLPVGKYFRKIKDSNGFFEGVLDVFEERFYHIGDPAFIRKDDHNFMENYLNGERKEMILNCYNDNITIITEQCGVGDCELVLHHLNPARHQHIGIDPND